jgi:two-component system, NtrC family, sensor histidine kinase PilS
MRSRKKGDSFVAQIMQGDNSPSLSHWKSIRLLSACRVVLALLIAIWVPLAEQGAFRLELSNEPRFFGVALAYVGVALLFWAANRWFNLSFKPQLLTTTLVDIAFLGLLMHDSGGVRASFAILLIAPVAAASVLSSRLQAVFFAAAASLMLLAETTVRILNAESTDFGVFVQAGIVGAATFLTALLINQLAIRLAQQERIVEQRDLDLREQLEINQRIIAELQEGVVILDDEGEPRAMNNAAERMLGGMGVVLPTLLPDGAAVPWTVPAEEGRPVGKVLIRSVSTSEASGSGLIFVQDQLEVEQRAQQLKLASMGRLSASIAHEIRNPLSAIRHANALLGERLEAVTVADESSSVAKRLVSMIESNSVRINRIIEDVLSIARRGKNGEGQSIDDLPRHAVKAFLDDWLSEYCEQEAFDPALISVLSRSTQTLAFDPNHLRQVLVNLVGNARRYSSGHAGAIVLKWRQREVANGVVDELLIVDDGPGLSANQSQHLFEPFYSSESTGVGLGLYLARELCAANGAELVYEAFTDEEIIHAMTAPRAFIVRSTALVKNKV